MNIVEQLQEIADRHLKTSKRRNSPIIHTKQRSEIKHEMEDAFKNQLEELCQDTDLDYFVGMTADGLILGLTHKSLQNTKDSTGDVCLEINIKVKNLDYDFFVEQDLYKKELEEKERKKTAKKKSKERKIQQDIQYRKVKKEREK